MTAAKTIQVSLLRVANNSLMRHLADVSHRYINISIDNRVLKANVETLEAKVCLASTLLCYILNSELFSSKHVSMCIAAMSFNTPIKCFKNLKDQ